jgi:hypothetical protein
MKRISLVSVLVLSLVGAGPVLGATKPKPHAAVIQAAVQKPPCGVYYKYTC